MPLYDRQSIHFVQLFGRQDKHAFTHNCYIKFWGQIKFYTFIEMTILVLESEVTQSCPTLCDPMGCSLPGFSIHGISQARILEWLASSFTRGSSQPRNWTRGSCIGRQISLPLSHQGSPRGLKKINESKKEKNGEASNQNLSYGFLTMRP